MLGYWRDDAVLVGHLRCHLAALPSEVGDTGRNRGAADPRWGDVLEELNRRFPQYQRANERAMWLEQTTRKAARRQVKPPLVSQVTMAFWQHAWAQLVGGFPGYAFRSHLAYWWSQCLVHYRFDWQVPPQGPDPGAGKAHPERALDERLNDLALATLTPEQLLWCVREGYRFVRTTFFRRPGRDVAREDIGAANGRVAGDRLAEDTVADENEAWRCFVDDIWLARLAHRLGDDDLPEQAIKEILARHPGVPEKTVHGLCHRLRCRMLAYNLSRLRGFTNAEIRSVRHPNDREKRPLAREPAVLTVATLARCVPWHRTFLWAFTSHVFVYPRIVPQHPDKWHPARFLRELRVWATDPLFEVSVKRAAHEGSRPDVEALHLFGEPVIRQTLDDWRAARAYRDAASSEPEFVQRVAEAARQVAGSGGLHLCPRNCFTARPRVGHWIVPLWYLDAVEDLPREEALTRLRIDVAEVNKVGALHENVRRCRTCEHNRRQAAGGHAP
jgi:hypothetical protein